MFLSTSKRLLFLMTAPVKIAVCVLHAHVHVRTQHQNLRISSTYVLNHPAVCLLLQINLAISDPTDLEHKPVSLLQATDSYPEFTVLYQSSMGQSGNWQFDKTAYPMYTKFIFVFFSILVTIVSMNLLIAMISFTFNRIYKEAERAWWLQRAEIILGYESNFSARWHKFLIKSAAYVQNEVQKRFVIARLALLHPEQSVSAAYEPHKFAVRHSTLG